MVSTYFHPAVLLLRYQVINDYWFSATTAAAAAAQTVSIRSTDGLDFQVRTFDFRAKFAATCPTTPLWGRGA